MSRFLFFLIVILPSCLHGQFSGALHYTVKDGLPSSTVYCSTLDELGFMWIGTEAGLVRFDGTRFKVFTRRDGLPDNEVLGLHFDSITNRLWIVTYSKMACYYRNGRIYTSRNDSSLTKIKCDIGEFIDANSQRGVGVFLYNGGTLYKCANEKVIVMKPNVMGMLSVHQQNDTSIDILATVKGLIRYAPHRSVAQDVFHDSIFSRGAWIDQRFFLFQKGAVQIYNCKSGSYRFDRTISFERRTYIVAIIKQGGKYIMSMANDGVYECDTAGLHPPHMIWKGNPNGLSLDRDDNIWVSTKDDGIYILKNGQADNYNVGKTTSLLFDSAGSLFGGDNLGGIYQIKNSQVESLSKFAGGRGDIVRGMESYGHKLMYLSDVVNIYDKSTKNLVRKVYRSGGPKSILKLRDGSRILIGFSYSIVDYNYCTDSHLEHITAKRVITMAQHPDGRVFCGSLDGLYTYKDDSLTPVVTDDPRMHDRITALFITADGLLWIGTPSSGVLISDGRRVLRNINLYDDRSFHGTMCRKLISAKAGEIWVATNDGVNMIRYHRADSLVIDNITPIDTRDGLRSNDVYDIQVRDSMVAIATSAGLTLVNVNHLKAATTIPVYISTVKINDQDSAVNDGIYCLRHLQNNIAIEYIGVALPVGSLSYQYRLLGSDNDSWATTTNTSIEFRSLSPGDYAFEVVVLDKFGNKSKGVARVRFKITPAFYMTIWFWALIMISILTIGFYIIRARFQRQQKRFEKEQGLNNKIIELEQQALKAQMNPHFIFNCLTAIQHFVNREDMYAANMYLSNFAKLIRKTLDLSGEQYISLDKEVSYLENYIQLEKLRFQEKFQYTVIVAPDIDEYNVSLPPMLLQPIIENAIRHGLRNMDDDAGILSVAFALKGTRLVATIDDNGVGRKKTREMKTTAHIEYQSKGMSLTMSRIQAINMISDKKITIEIKDKYNDNNESEGTLFILTFEQDENT